MANLFPIGSIETIVPKENKIITLGKSYAIDFQTMKLKKNLDGTVKILDEYEAYVQWCQLAMMTERNVYKAFTHLFGIDDVNMELSKQAIELECKRTTIEALMAHPNTKSVDEFTFEWRKNYSELFYEYKITPKLGKTKILSRIIKIVKEV